MIINVKDRVILLHNPKTGGRFRCRACNNKYYHAPSAELKAPVKGMLSHLTYADAKKAIADTFYLYKVYTGNRKPYDRNVSSVNFAFNVFETEMEANVDNALTLLEADNSILFSHERPWFNPQSFYLGEGVHIFQYESEDDWRGIARMLDFNFSLVKIKPSYELTAEQKKRIRDIYYPYDKAIFDIYEGGTNE